jgi:hypothetical protein
MNKILIFCLCLVLNLLSIAFSAEAEKDKDWTFDPKTSSLIPKYLGKIKVMQGKAIIGERELKKGSKVYNNDLIQTSENSFVVMEMIDLTTVTLGPLTDFKVDNWSYRTKNDRDAHFNIIKGQWRAFVRSKSKEADQLKVKTPLISMGIRGTELMVNVLKQNGKDITQVALLDGAIHIEEGASVKSKDMIPGDHEVIIKDGVKIDHRLRKMNDLEIKSYQEFSAPEVLRLLDPVRNEESELQASNTKSPTVIDDANTVSDLASSPASKIKSIPDKSVQDKLQILNEVREENRKQK